MNGSAKFVALLVVAAVLALAAGCGGEARDDGGLKQVRGHVVEVTARNIAEFETLTIRDDEGREYTFTSEGFTGFTPSHLREHRLFGQSLLVTYREDDGRLVAVKTED